MKPLYRVLLVLAVLIGALAWRRYEKSQLKQATRTEVVAACAGHAACESAVAQHFEPCFEVGTRSQLQSKGVDKFALAECINLRAGQPLLIPTKKR